MSKKYTEEFKQQILSLHQSGHSVAELCRLYDLGKNTIREWLSGGKKRKVKEESTLASEVQQLRKEVKELREETVLLKRLSLVLIQNTQK